MKRAARRILSLLVFLLPLTALIVLGYLTIRRYYPIAERDLAPALAVEISRATGHETRVGGVTLQGQKALIDDVHIALKSTFAASAGQEIASARRVVVDVDLRNILFEKNPRIPVVANAEAIDPIAHIARDQAGRWNFQDIFRPRVKPPQRPGIGNIRVVNGRLVYHDASAPHHLKRPSSPVDAAFATVTGRLSFYPDSTVTWSFAGKETTGLAASAVSHGSYEPSSKRLYVRVDAVQLSLSQTSRFLPPDTQVIAGFGTGHLTLIRPAAGPHGAPFDFQGEMAITGASATHRSLAEPVTGVSGTAQVNSGIVFTTLNGYFAGSRVQVDGSACNLSDPWLAGTVKGERVVLRRVLSALRVANRYPALRDVQAMATVNATLAGKPDSLRVAATGQAAVHGSMRSGPSAATAGDFQVAVSGPLSNPRVRASGTLPLVRWRGYEARQLHLTGWYDAGSLAADFHTAVGGGLVAGHVFANGIDTPRPAHIQLRARARRIQLAQLPAASELGARGTVDSDFALKGPLSTRLDHLDGAAIIKVDGLKLNQWTASTVRGGLRFNGKKARLDPLLITGPEGFAVVSGTIDTATKQLDLVIDADEVDLARLPIAIGSAKQNPLTGTAYLREGRITGGFRQPRYSGVLRGYGIAAGEKLSLDFAVAKISGDRNLLTISEGQAWRFPAFTRVDGMIRDPASPRAQLGLSGEFDKVDLQDLAALAGSALKASGTAHGAWLAEGLYYLTRPFVTADSIEIENPKVGNYSLDRLTASAVYDATSGVGNLSIPQFSGVTHGVTVAGNAGLEGGKRFHVHASTTDIDLKLLEGCIEKYAVVSGAGVLSADVSGDVVGGEATNLDGTITADTHELVINSERFGEIHGLFGLSGDTLLSNQISLGPAESGIRVRSLVYDLTTGMVDLKGSVQSIALDSLRRALVASPYVRLNPESIAATRLRPITTPFAGFIDGDFRLSGEIDDPVADVTWNGRDMVIEQQAIQTLTGGAQFTRNSVEVRNALLKASDTQVTANGTWIAEKKLQGEMDVNNLPLHVLQRWFPDALPRFRVEDILDAANLVRRLRDEADPLARHLRDQMTPQVRDMLMSSLAGVPSNELLRDLVRELNRITRTGGPLYTPERFASYKPLPATVRLLESNPTGRGLIHLNRALLADAFAGLLHSDPVETPILAGLTGNAEQFNISANGTPSEPNLTITMDLTNVEWTDPAGAALNGRTLRFARVFSTPITYRQGKLAVDDISLELLEATAPKSPAPATAATPTPSGATTPTAQKTPLLTPAEQAARPYGPPEMPGRGPAYEAHIRQAVVDFALEDLSLGDSARFTLGVDRQPLSIFTVLAPGAAAGVVGEVTASMTYDGSLRALTERALTSTPSARPFAPPKITGQMALTAARIARPGFATELRDVDAKLTFAAGKVTIDHFTGLTAASHPRFAKRVSEPFTLTGDLPVTDPSISSQGLKFLARKLVFAEAPLPVLGSGTAVGEAGTDDPRTPEVESLAIKGTLFNPTISGSVYIRQTVMRLPDTIAQSAAASLELPFVPTFDLKFIVLDNARVTTAQLSADVRTSPTDPVALTGRIDDPRVSGSLVVDRGTLIFPTARFSIQRGGLVSLRYPSTGALVLPERSLGIVVNLVATTRMTATSLNGVRKRYTITVEARGPINSSTGLKINEPGLPGEGLVGDRGLRLTFRADPPDLALSGNELQRRVTGLLGGQNAIEELFSRNPNLGRVVGDQFTDVLSASVLPELFERTGFARALGFEELTIEYSRLDAFTLRLSRPLFGPLFIEFWRSLSGANTAGNTERAAWELKLGYRILDNLQFSYTLDEQRTNAFLIEGVYRF